MKLEYKYGESTVKPPFIERGYSTVYIHKDIVSEERENLDGSTTTFWTYQEAKMPIEEFDKYIELLMANNAIKGVNDSENISQLVDGQANGDNNQLIIMEAIADLYDVIASLM